MYVKIYFYYLPFEKNIDPLILTMYACVNIIESLCP